MSEEYIDNKNEIGKDAMERKISEELGSKLQGILSGDLHIASVDKFGNVLSSLQQEKSSSTPDGWLINSKELQANVLTPDGAASMITISGSEQINGTAKSQDPAEITIFQQPYPDNPQYMVSMSARMNAHSNVYEYRIAQSQDGQFIDPNEKGELIDSAAIGQQMINNALFSALSAGEQYDRELQTLRSRHS